MADTKTPPGYSRPAEGSISDQHFRAITKPTQKAFGSSRCDPFQRLLHGPLKTVPAPGANTPNWTAAGGTLPTDLPAPQSSVFSEPPVFLAFRLMSIQRSYRIHGGPSPSQPAVICPPFYITDKIVSRSSFGRSAERVFCVL